MAAILSARSSPVVVLVVHLASAILRPSSITLENNEYRNVLVAISADIPEDAALIQKLKTVFSDASSYLYQATKHRAVFRNVVILVPSTWRVNTSYGPATWQVSSNADVVLTGAMSTSSSVQTPGQSSQPPGGGLSEEFSITTAANAAFTKSYAGCGQQGIRITMTTDLFTNRVLASAMGSPERVLVHEWARFRWGVFNEYSEQDELKFYYSPTTGQLEGVRCTERVGGAIYQLDPHTGKPLLAPDDSPVQCTTVDKNTGLYPDSCVFLPYPSEPTISRTEASIMDRVFVDSIVKFCEDDTTDFASLHNYYAPSRHNRLCAHRSTWAVIGDSEDFMANRNAPREGLDTTPVFAVLQAPRTHWLVLALDTSSSMAEDHKLLLMRQAVASFITDGIPPGTVVGLVTFNENAQVHRAPVALNTAEDRRKFVDDLPTHCGGATSITTGLISAAEVLQSTSRGSGASGSRDGTFVGHVLVITDGQQTTGPDLSSAEARLEAVGVAVSFILLGGEPPEPLLSLAHNTGGRGYYDNNSPESTASVDAAFDFLEVFNADSASPTELYSTARRLGPKQSMEDRVAVDSDVGQTTVFVISYTQSVPHLWVRSPTGRVYDRRYPEYALDARVQLIKIQIPYKAETGKWKYEVTNTGDTQRISVLVLSSPSNASSAPVHVSGTFISSRTTGSTTLLVVGEATRRGRPVLGLTVYATVFGPSGDAVHLTQLMDNGAGSDIVEDDGIYSRYFSRFQGPGCYALRLRATGYCPEGANTSQCTTDPQYENVDRTVSGGYIFISQNISDPAVSNGHDSGSDDTEAPVRISDLRVVKTSSKNRTVVLSWRASGDDKDQETASEYEVLFAPTIADLLTHSSLVHTVTKAEVVHGSLQSPQSFGTREYLTVRVPVTNVSLVFTVIAIDDAGNKGEHSNYVTVGLGTAPDLTDHRYWTDGQFADDAVLAPPRNQRIVIACVLGTFSGLLLLVLLYSFATTYVCKRKRPLSPGASKDSRTVRHSNGASSIYVLQKTIHHNGVFSHNV